MNPLQTHTHTERERGRDISFRKVRGWKEKNMRQERKDRNIYFLLSNYSPSQEVV